MARERIQIDYHVTPVGIGRSVFVSAPSTKFNADGVFSTKLVLDREEASGLMAVLDKAVEAALEDAIRKNPKLKKQIKKAEPYTDDLDEDGEETGKVVFSFKRVHRQKLKDGTVKVNKVKVIDTDGKVIDEPVWAGSKFAVRFFITPYFMESDKSAGLSLKMTHVLVADLVSAGSGDGDEDVSRLGFGKIDGYKSAGKKAASADDEETAEDEDGNADF